MPDEIPEEKFVMTTWHEKDSLEEVFWFAKYNAFHPVILLERTLLLHVSEQAMKNELMRRYSSA